MQLTTVESSMIHAIGYDQAKRVLEVVFNTGRTYQYGDVSLEVYEAFMQAESKGRYFLANIRDVYEYWQAGRGRR